MDVVAHIHMQLSFNINALGDCKLFNFKSVLFHIYVTEDF
jgi:hypothetical protein